MSDQSNAEHIRFSATQFLDCEPGTADTPDGPRVVLLHLAQEDAIMPMMMSPYDAKRMMLRLVVTLMEQGDADARALFASKLSTNYTVRRDGPRPRHSENDPDPLINGNERHLAYRQNCPRSPIADRPPIVSPPPDQPSLPMLPPTPPTSAADAPLPNHRPRAGQWCCRLSKRTRAVSKCVIQYGRDYRPRNAFHILGGYSDGVSHYFLARRTRRTGCEDGIFKMLSLKSVALWRDHSGDFLPDDAWDRFFLTREGKTFEYSGRKWTRMRVSQIAALVHGRLFKAV